MSVPALAAAPPTDLFANFDSMMNDSMNTPISHHTPTPAAQANASLLPSTNIHKTSADDYFDLLGKQESIDKPAAAAAVPAVSGASKLTSMLGDHKDLVDLDNICTPQKRK